MKKGFTLIELLIVIAILGILAVVVLVAIDPVQQLERTRDSSRTTNIASLGHAMESLGTVRDGRFPADGTTANHDCEGVEQSGATWITNCLVNTGEVKQAPTAPVGSTVTCTNGQSEGNFCYDGNANAFVIYTNAIAKSNLERCTGTGVAFFVYASAHGRAGIWCDADVPTPGEASRFVN